MSQNNKLDFLREAGGRWFLEARFLLLTVPLVISTSLLTTGPAFLPVDATQNETLGIYGRLLLASVFALLICAAWVILFSKTLFVKRNIRPIPFGIVIFFGAGVGALKGAATGLGSWILQIEPLLNAAIASRVWQTTLLGAWLIPAVALVAARLSSLQDKREALVAERVSNTLIENGKSRTRENQAALRDFAMMAKNELSKITDSPGAAESSAKYANAIRRLVTDQLRPLSHRIWEQENKRISSFSFAATVRNSIFNFTKPRLVVSLIYLVTAIPAILRFVPIAETIGRSLLAGTSIFLGLWLASLYQPKKYWAASTYFLVSIGVISYFNFLAGEFVFGAVPEFGLLETILVIWIWLLQLTFISSFLSGMRVGGSVLDQELSDLFGSKSIDRAVRQSQARIQNREFANYLHGQVQNKLLSVALGLEKGEATKQQLRESLEMVESILTSLNSSFPSLHSDDIEFEISKMTDQWQGFLTIEWDIVEGSLNLESGVKVLLIQVIEEAISNSVRHGLSRNLKVSFEDSDELKLLSVIDDGIGPRNGKPGLGSSFFGNVSSGNWSLIQLPSGGSKLTVHF